jgi:tripartite-type tricarboxylate transporter receptor subunit TctC
MSRSAVPTSAVRCATAVLLGLAGFPATGTAQIYPAKPLRLIVPFAPGGTNDIMARGVAPELSAIFGQQVVVDNRGGASGQIGAEAVAKSPPDGYTLMLVSSSVMSHGPAVNPSLRYDMVRDFAPVGKVSEVPLVIVVHPTVPAKTTRQFVALAKSRPNDLRMAIGGTGTTSHLVTELFAVATGTRMLIVPYKGAGPALVDLLGGHLDGRIDQIPSSMPYIQSDRLRAIAVTTTRRAQLLPELPTLAESGVPGFDASTVIAIFVPVATPQDIVQRLNTALNQALGSAALKERLASQGAEPRPGTSEELGRFVREDLAKWKKVVQQTGIKLE